MRGRRGAGHAGRGARALAACSRSPASASAGAAAPRARGATARQRRRRSPRSSAPRRRSPRCRRPPTRPSAPRPPTARRASTPRPRTAAGRSPRASSATRRPRRRSSCSATPTPRCGSPRSPPRPPRSTTASCCSSSAAAPRRRSPSGTPSRSPPFPAGPYTACNRFRSQAIKAINRLHPVARAPVQPHRDGPVRQRHVLHGRAVGERRAHDDRRSSSGAHTKVAVIGDIVYFNEPMPQCLAALPDRACSCARRPTRTPPRTDTRPPSGPRP